MPNPEIDRAPNLVSRREALMRVAMLMGGALSAPTLAGVLAGCERPRELAAWQPQTLTGDRSELVATLAEHILPETDTPGARAARVEEFIDAMLTGYYPEEERTRFLAGLERLDARAQHALGKPFLELSPGQQLELAQVYNRHAFRQAAAAGDPIRPAPQPTDVETGRSLGETTLPSGTVLLDSEWDPADVGRQSFFFTLKELVLVGYYTSEIGATQELRVNPMGTWRADVPYDELGRAWA